MGLTAVMLSFYNFNEKKFNAINVINIGNTLRGWGSGGERGSYSKNTINIRPSMLSFQR